VIGVQSGSFKLIFALLYFEVSILFADDIQFTYHIEVFDQVIRIDVEGKDLFTTLVSTHAFLELKFALFCPSVVRVYIEDVLLSLNDKHSILWLFYKISERYFKL
jgi:hypothetical protein